MDEISLSLPPFSGYEREGHRQYQLTLRGNSLNPMIDAATPLRRYWEWLCVWMG